MARSLLVSVFIYLGSFSLSNTDKVKIVEVTHQIT